MDSVFFNVDLLLSIVRYTDADTLVSLVSTHSLFDCLSKGRSLDFLAKRWGMYVPGFDVAHTHYLYYRRHFGLCTLKVITNAYELHSVIKDSISEGTFTEAHFNALVDHFTSPVPIKHPPYKIAITLKGIKHADVDTNISLEHQVLLSEIAVKINRLDLFRSLTSVVFYDEVVQLLKERCIHIDQGYVSCIMYTFNTHVTADCDVNRMFTSLDKAVRSNNYKQVMLVIDTCTKLNDYEQRYLCWPAIAETVNIAVNESSADIVRVILALLPDVYFSVTKLLISAVRRNKPEHLDVLLKYCCGRYMLKLEERTRMEVLVEIMKVDSVDCFVVLRPYVMEMVGTHIRASGIAQAFNSWSILRYLGCKLLHSRWNEFVRGILRGIFESIVC